MIRILKIDKNPLTTIGEIAGVCYNSTNPKHFENIAKKCLIQGHTRVAEFVGITLEIDGYSAKMVRELYTHISGTSRVQSSTRYIDYSNGMFDYVTPPSVVNSHNEDVWHSTMIQIAKAMECLRADGVPVEDLTNLLPLAYTTKMVLQINLRALIHMFNVRACACAYHEYRTFMAELNKLLRVQGNEWVYLSDQYFKPKCEAVGYCEEVTRSCGRKPIKNK